MSGAPQAVEEKSPAAVLDWTVDFSDQLRPGESLASVTWGVFGPDGFLLVGSGERAPTLDATRGTVWLTGGRTTKRYFVTARPTTDATPPRVLNDYTFAIDVRQT